MALAAVSTIGYLGFLVGPPYDQVCGAGIQLKASFSIIALMGICIAIMGSRG